MDETSSGSESRRTAFHDIMSKTAAGFMEEAGWFWVTGFGDPEAEYEAVREGVGVWDVSPLNKWDFRGPDAARGGAAGPLERHRRDADGPGPIRRVPR